MFGPNKGKGGDIGKSDDDLVKELIEIHNSENWLGENESEVNGRDPNLVQTGPALDPNTDESEEHCESPDSGVSLDTTPPLGDILERTTNLGDSSDHILEHFQFQSDPPHPLHPQQCSSQIVTQMSALATFL